MKINLANPMPLRTRPVTPLLALTALGIVYGDIGTSPLYAVKELFAPGHGVAATTDNVIGGISTILWALLVVVCLKYVVLVMRADNRGEGGIMALTALASAALRQRPKLRTAVTLLGIAGASLFFGESVLTPAISVVSAVEGLAVGSAAFEVWVVPIAAGVLIALFCIQKSGTARVGRLFGPVCLLWFAALAGSGLWNLAETPEILAALDPRHAVAFLAAHGAGALLILGAVLLAFTGAEALYADMGHLGRQAIRLAWFIVVFPALGLNYLGQGALLIAHPEAARNPYYLAFPAWALYPMVGLATAATVIASQATITGAFSLARQAMQLGFLARMRVIHTSVWERGQVYLPVVNWTLLVLVLATVVMFGDSSSLASAYGVSVTGTMVITTVLSFFVLRFRWNFPVWLCLLPTAFFLFVDVSFFLSALLKVFAGGWFPLLLASLVCTAMLTWRRGRQLLVRQAEEASEPLEAFLEALFAHPLTRVPGTAVFLSSNPAQVPHALLHNLKHNKVLHSQAIFLSIEFAEVPWTAGDQRLHAECLGHGCWRLRARLGFMNRPDVPGMLEAARTLGIETDMMTVSYFLSRAGVVASQRIPGMARWREHLFVAMLRNASHTTDYLNIPANRTVELGARIEI